MHVCVYLYLSVCLSFCLSICLSIPLSISVYDILHVGEKRGEGGKAYIPSLRLCHVLEA